MLATGEIIINIILRNIISATLIQTSARLHYIYSKMNCVLLSTYSTIHVNYK